MNPIKLYTVKEAAKVVGVSTNTLYKYLDEGKIHAARGSAQQGRFRIPESALEEFLGVKLASPEPVAPVIAEPKIVAENQSLTALTTSKPRFPLKLVRLLLILALIAILLDLFIAGTVSLPLMISRLLFVVIMLLLAYQEGGYRRSNRSL